MMSRVFLFIITVTLCQFLIAHSAQSANCTARDRGCILNEIEAESANIENKNWRDQTYRELAKTKAADGDMNGAIRLIDKIETPDTQAMTIRGIGMAAADLKLEQPAYDALFEKLRLRAEKIEHPPSYAIALTYIAMAQAFAGDNEGAWKTASEMENDALRHKAYGETAEIQAQAGDSAAAMKSISFINSSAFRNKSYALVAKILADRKEYDGAIAAAMAIKNPYKKAKALQQILDAQKSRDIIK